LWVLPIFRYQVTRRRLGRELSRYLAQRTDRREPRLAADAPGRNKAEVLRSARQNANRLVDCYRREIPFWYRLLLDSRSQSPDTAEALLTHLDKIRDRAQVAERVTRVRRAIGLK
jgi:hypothetical protein